MGSVQRVEDRTFKVNFTEEGVANLRQTVRDKLKEFMGDYTDDTLVEYVIVLLRNGRRKEEARNELNVFLGDDSDSFVSWLWDHLSSNLDLYIHPQESYPDAAAKTKLTLADHPGRSEAYRMDIESERGTSGNLPRSQHRREWKGLTRDEIEPPPLRSSEVDNIHLDVKTDRKVSRARRSPSPRPVQKKRSRHDERQSKKREEISQATVNAPRRLLQFAVRDAVATLKPSLLVKEPSLKRLRSVVSTSTNDSSLVDRPRRIQSIARVPNPMATVIKAVQEAAEDVIKVKPVVSVFDRLGRDRDISEAAEQFAQFGEADVEDEEYEEFNQIQEQNHANYLQRRDHVGHEENVTMLENESRLASDLISYNEGYDDVNALGHVAGGVPETGTSAGNRGEDSFMVGYSSGMNDVVRITQSKDQEQTVSAANTSRNMANISANSNTWKPSHYLESREVADMNKRKSILENKQCSGKSGGQLFKENSNLGMIGNANGKPATNIQKESQKTLPPAPGLYTAGRPLEDADSRTIFVSNVHYAATNDLLSRHFNKFGDVLKVVIVKDQAGQPTGSAYVEFMRKEAADNALSLDGTSFMSRIVKVVKRSAAQEATLVSTWSRVARGSPYPPASRYPRVPVPRGISSTFRARPPLKYGARSLQWKRDAQATPTETVAPVYGNSGTSSSARSLTYVRTEPKPDGRSGTT